MDATNELSRVKSEILEKIKTLAGKGDVKALAVWTQAAQQCETLLKDSADLLERIDKFKKSLSGGWGEESEPPSNKDRAWSPALDLQVSAKKWGAMMRESWVKEMAAKGVKLRGHGKSYHSENGKSVGIAPAREKNRSQLINKWFLGLKDEPLDIVVLLCCDLNGVVHDLVIPVPEIGDAWKALSRSGGQVKFNIRRSAGGFSLAVPGRKEIQVSQYIGDYKPLIS